MASRPLFTPSRRPSPVTLWQTWLEGFPAYSSVHPVCFHAGAPHRRPLLYPLSYARLFVTIAYGRPDDKRDLCKKECVSRLILCTVSRPSHVPREHHRYFESLM